MRNIQVICEEKYFEKRPKNTVVYVEINNLIDTTQFWDITVENVSLNGEAVAEENMVIALHGNINNFSVKTR